MFHSKGYLQSEIARKLNVNQSAISRDISEIKEKARSPLVLYLKEEIPREFQLYISGINQIIKNLLFS
jgi:transcriptional regulator